MKKERPELNKLLEQLRPDDLVIVWKLDRLARSTRNLLEIVGRIAAKQWGVQFGRPQKMNEEQKLLAKRLLEENKSVNEIAKTFNVHKATIYRLED